jgi:dynein heavy chain
MGRGQSERA